MKPSLHSIFSFWIKNISKQFVFIVIVFSSFSTQAQHSVAREWNELLLLGIRNDFARPTVHARNLFHTSIAMYDAWAIYDTIAEPFLLGKTVDGFTCDFDSIPPTIDIEAARKEAISFAAYRIIRQRFQFSPGASILMPTLDALMADLGYDIAITSTNYSTGTPADLGNYIAQCILNFGMQDGSNEQIGYNNISYQPVNPPMIMALPGNPDMIDPNRWQPLTLDFFIDQSGNLFPFNTPDFLSPEWGQVTPFALSQDDVTIYERDGFDYKVYHDPGLPPYLDTTAVGGISEEFKWGFSLVSIWSSHLDPNDSVMIDISPATFGNIPDSLYPTTTAGLRDFYNYIEGGDPSMGHSMNPKTGQPYAEQIVPRADYARVLAEFWADGPDSETPPGHWFTLLNYVNDHPDFVRKYRGQGDTINALEWDVKAYMMMGGAMHDCAITAWGIKGWYDYPRPVSAIRKMAGYGQSSDPNLPSYHPGGILLEPGYIELVDSTDALVGDSFEHLGKIKLYAWKGPDSIPNISTTYAGVGWILAENWWPYQRPSFVTPPFAGYVSGHSTYSRAAADIMTMLTGDEFFPGGVGEFEAPMNEFLVFEDGPSQSITLQWATYRDASEQTSLSRIWGGIHPPVDDIPGRLIGIEIAKDAFDLAESLFFVDADNDGFYNYQDCDDNNPNINPDIPETCDGIDNNCNALIDEGLAIFTYYTDADGDGFGNTNITLDTCAAIPPIGFVTNDSDCDDTNMLINPDAPEACDAVDNNCNVMIDEGLPSFQFFRDADGDGFGNANITLDTCAAIPPIGFVTNDSDCDDTNMLINPDAPEACDEVDNNCNVMIDEGLPNFQFFRDADGDGFGNAAITLDTCSMNPPVGFVSNDDDCDDTNNMIHPNATEECDEVDNNCNGMVDDGLPLFQFFQDSDGDMFGNPDSVLQSCFSMVPIGYVFNDDDCDDNNFDINPSVMEVYDSLDNDCNGLIDDGVTSLKKLNNPFHLKFSPNPTQYELNIQFEYDDNLIFSVINVDGKVLLEKFHSQSKYLSLDVSSLSPALYFLKIESEDRTKMEIHQFVKY